MMYLKSSFNIRDQMLSLIAINIKQYYISRAVMTMSRKMIMMNDDDE